MTLLGVDIGTTHVKAAPTTKTAGSSALASGLVERAPLSFPIIFLGLGFLIGEEASDSSRSVPRTRPWRR